MTSDFPKDPVLQDALRGVVPLVTGETPYPRAVPLSARHAAIYATANAFVTEAHGMRVKNLRIVSNGEGWAGYSSVFSRDKRRLDNAWKFWLATMPSLLLAGGVAIVLYEEQPRLDNLPGWREAIQTLLYDSYRIQGYKVGIPQEAGRVLARLESELSDPIHRERIIEVAETLLKSAPRVNRKHLRIPAAIRELYPPPPTVHLMDGDIFRDIMQGSTDI